MLKSVNVKRNFVIFSIRNVFFLSNVQFFMLKNIYHIIFKIIICCLQAKEKFVKKTLADKNCKDPKNNLTNEEMSEFYTQFLNDKWMSHLRYNYEWQKRNFKIAVLSIAVAAQKIIS